MANPTANQVLAVAARDIGKTESPPGSNRGPATGWPEVYPAWSGSPWCQAVAQAWLLRAGFPAIKLPGGKVAFAGPAPFHTTMSLAAARAGRLGGFKAVSSPRRGDLMIFKFSHVGIVERVRSDGMIVTIEGNTSPGNRGSQANGGGIYRRVRPRSLAAGFIRPPYGTGARAPKPALKLPIVVDGDWGPQSKMAWEKYLQRPVDGVFDRMDVRQLQTWASRPRTGVLSRDDIRAIQTKLGMARTGRLTPDVVAAMQMFVNRRLTGKAR